MEDSQPALWIIVATGVAIGLLASLIAHGLLQVPRLRIKIRHVAGADRAGVTQLTSYVSVTNLRGRPVQIDQVMILNRRPRGGPGMGRPKGWTFPQHLTEGQNVKFTFDRDQFPNAVPVIIDSADRIWPRRRWLRVKRRAFAAGGLIGWPWQRNGPTQKQLDRLAERVEEIHRRRSKPPR